MRLFYSHDVIGWYVTTNDHFNPILFAEQMLENCKIKIDCENVESKTLCIVIQIVDAVSQVHNGNWKNMPVKVIILISHAH